MCPPDFAAHQQHAANVRRAGLATLRATQSMGYPSSTGVMTSDDLVRAADSLYDDEIQPLSRILKRRLVELSGDANLRAMDIDLGALRVAVSVAAPRLVVNPVEGGDWEAVLTHRPPSFVDVHSACDNYGEEMWQDFVAYIDSLHSPEAYRLPSSRYACAFELRSRNLPFFAGLTLGALCHIVQLAISQKKILGHRDGSLVPYVMSKCFLKEKHAELGVAQAVSANSEASTMPFATWATVRACLMDIMNVARHSDQGCEPLANIKRLFRTRYHLELSETLLGYTKLSDVLQAPQVSDLCSLEMRNSSCCVVPTSIWNAAAANHNIRASNDFCSGQNSEVLMDCHVQPTPCQQQSNLTESDTTTLPISSQNSEADMEFHVQSPLQLLESSLSESGDIRSMVKNTFIEHPGQLTMEQQGARRRSRSVPKDFGSTKDDWETACHVLSYKHKSVRPERSLSTSVRKIVLERHGCDLGLAVSCEGKQDSEFLLIEDVGPGPVELWNLSHPGETIVQAGDLILEVNGVSGDAQAMLRAVQAYDTLELTLELSSRNIERENMPSSPVPWEATSAPAAWQVAGSAPQMPPMQPMPPVAPMPMIPASVPQLWNPHVCALSQNCPPNVFIHSEPPKFPKIFVHSGPPQVF